MRIAKYNIRKDKKTKKVCLVKEKQTNYPLEKRMDNPQKISDFFYNSPIKADTLCEEYVWLLTTTTNNFNSLFEISHGGANKSCFYIREICQKALMVGATEVILVHNHPSGSLSPSREDVLITQKLKNAFELIGVNFCDHIIIGSNLCYYSFLEQERL